MVEGYQDGIRNQNKKILAENAELKAQGRDQEIKPIVSLDAPRPKPVPKNGMAQLLEFFQIISVDQLATLPADKQLVFNKYGYTLKTTETDGKVSYSVDQDINRLPNELNPALNLKLNGVHKKYADQVIAFMSNSYINRHTPMPADILHLSSLVHKIWMDDAAWKVEGSFKKYLNITDTFYSLNAEARMAHAAEILNAFGDKLTPDEKAALEQFRPYEQLSDQDKRLDDQILADILTDLSQQVTAANQTPR